MKKILIAAIVALVSMASLCRADNPVTQTHFSPDPAPMVYKNTVYMYTGDDIPGYDTRSRRVVVPVYPGTLTC